MAIEKLQTVTLYQINVPVPATPEYGTTPIVDPLPGPAITMSWRFIPHEIEPSAVLASAYVIAFCVVLVQWIVLARSSIRSGQAASPNAASVPGSFPPSPARVIPLGTVRPAVIL